MSARTRVAPAAARGSSAVPPSGARTLRLGSKLSIRYRRRSLLLSVLLAVAVLLVGAFTLTAGKLGLSWTELLALAVSPPEGSGAFVLERLRGPRFLTAVGAGMALGVAGSLFQTVTRNPLGSPEVVGLTSGAAAGAAATALWPGYVPVPVAAILGGGLAVALVWLGTGRGFARPGKMIVAGIGISAVASALTSLAMTTLGEQQAQTLAFYLNGSLASRSWSHVAIIGIAVAVVLPAAAALQRRLNLVALGDELAESLGVRVDRTRTVAVLLAVVLAATAVSVCGPVAFVALVAPQIALRLLGTSSPGVVAPALVGALVLTLSDFTVQQIDVGPALPVGIFTAGLGSLYLGWLLWTEARKGLF
ncbi:iron chelate uptake ABC transporter family permease subunit [Arthrobacter sp. zg-Y20]|uniref:FecCD family ABC transporter permease n=1 Tax=Arthrobacter sp. zg-Y20 TaxID=2886938 RepID=UPI0024E02C73|nr:iron chelate uptake ABC transporter family permease subunit [Arthrobacter sp. zg-Y20]MCC3275184.1 iron chelate uptake ABC transporter family permease subunit [Arthrobacter sp. zg-Y20]MDK1315341.1 iron chelate uptake ABC transporter family permease subunit [Arthrobacter sp. zg.Y20]WIB05762.1 iron chelate uptake ABC transporter family permease subunit [Arthrobacter sp. zg-Y20]